MGPITRIVQTGVGLVAELKAAREERKAGEGVNVVSAEGVHMYEKNEEDEGSEDDENFGGGVMDDVVPASEQILPVDQPPAYTELESTTFNVSNYPRPSISKTKVKLGCPVVIPQRRPGSESRGFLRAYAPILEEFDLNQAAFLTFLKSFHKASQASPIFNVITIGAGAIGHISEPLTITVSLSISFLSGTAAEIQSRYRTNTFLDQANELLFKPRGLYCLVMSLRPDDIPRDNVEVQSVDTSSAALKWLDPEKSTFRAKLRTSSGTTHGEQEMPKTAPLIYTDTGYAELGKVKTNSGQHIGEFSTYQKVAENYFDKRAQAKYAYKHPESTLASQEKPKFASKYGDPTDPSVTMNYWGRAACKIQNESLADRQARRRSKALEAKHRGGVVRRLLQSSVLYLMIVNMPSKAEIETVKNSIKEFSKTSN
ncbi:hypothetical protein LARI1_G006932 [Lachnellula arida]|uniref:Uncharacterized protein n=1 Tax=Lachnellula arida TaxID=1316785 RepID=A0A8T9B4R1_9HELO|nr:hypothetical protein LARI1_G006932 [Lachnellula arida]